MSMKITNNDSYIISAAQSKSAAASVPAAAFEMEQSIKVNISREGLEQYRKSIQENSSESFDSMVARKAELISGKIQPETHFGFELGNRIAAIKSEDTAYRSTEQKASDLLKAYSSIYDEIVQGYESGTREKYVEDANADGGYRKLTVSEELEKLNSAYKNYADGIEIQAKQAKEIAPIFEEYKKQLDKIGAGRTKLASKAEEVYTNAKKEQLPENISEKILEASRIFAEQYRNPVMRAKGMDSILKGITIF